ncbi:hypothetical protein GRS96_02055 [Rathayibacter sp. VKM Ac-2803]|uniref:hypothetical protein n=1 Tax=unclassified Rathayibacter TaxID=2609250 RepID=UPI0013575AD9|nr:MULTISPECIES: hypothetical protein [unclassified Rathayibacter]MWV48057.1 hypothetical protein [Rathayibacter sp. VKM Ac-2803]MWV58722.1 hypothetical protein [Rathayibacter sp. VKM Ac-2754]
MQGMLESKGEIVGAIVVLVSAIWLVIAAFAVGAGDIFAFLGLITAFALGTTGVGIHAASREARFRRDKR